MTHVQFENVCTTLGAEEVHRDLTFHAERGQVACLLGPSGCGKTTALRILAGLLLHYRGTVLIDGAAPQRMWSRTALVFQSPRLAYWRTALENVLLGMELRLGRAGRHSFKERALGHLRAMGLGRDLDKYPLSLSGGEKHRVALARAFATEPELLLMDEPFSELDITTRNNLWDLTLELCRERDLTVVLVTHDLDEALYLADQVFVLSDKPSSVLASARIDAPHPRDAGAYPELMELRQRLRAILSVPPSPAAAAETGSPAFPGRRLR